MARHLESQEQRLFVQQWRLDPRTRDWPACAIPNGGRRGKVEAAILKAEGVSRGAPDWICFKQANREWVTFAGLALEFKSPTGKGRTSPEQQAWHAALDAEGWAVAVVTSAFEAWQVVRKVYGLD